MRTPIPEKLIAIVEEIDAKGNANLTRLTVLKKWFEAPGRLPAFGLWVARRSAGRKGKTKDAAGALLDEARALLGTTATLDSFLQPIDQRAARDLHDRARDCQNTFEQHQWGQVRIIPCWPLLLVEEGLALHLGLRDSPSDGYKLAADLCQHYDPRYGNGLNGPSRTKIMEIVRFMFTLEALEEHRRDFTVFAPGGERPALKTPSTAAKLGRLVDGGRLSWRKAHRRPSTALLPSSTGHAASVICSLSRLRAFRVRLARAGRGSRRR